MNPTTQSIIHLKLKVSKHCFEHRIGKEQKAHSFDLFDAAATRRNARAPTAAMLLARSSAARSIGNCISWECI